jgi:hypothetical protein
VKCGARRLIVKLTLCTLAGAVVTWGVAWECALWGELRGVRSARANDVIQWPGIVPDEWPPIRTASCTVAKFNTVKSGFSHREEQGSYELQVLESGWPMRALRSSQYVVMDASKVGRYTHSRGGAAMPTLSIWSDGCDIPLKNARRVHPLLLRPTPGALLPLCVMRTGFALNTLLAAGVLLGVVEGFALARRRVRRAKGRCVACGYDRGGLTGDAACPECGGLER